MSVKRNQIFVIKKPFVRITRALMDVNAKLATQGMESLALRFYTVQQTRAAQTQLAQRAPIKHYAVAYPDMKETVSLALTQMNVIYKDRVIRTPLARTRPVHLRVLVTRVTLVMENRAQR